MAEKLLHQLIANSAQRSPDAVAIGHKGKILKYSQLEKYVENIAAGLSASGITKSDRVAIYLPKSFENVISFFAIGRAGGIFVPVNPVLKAHQVEHIIKDCSANTLITTASRLESLLPNLKSCPDLKCVITLDNIKNLELIQKIVPDLKFMRFAELNRTSGKPAEVTVSEDDTAAILYTSGSTGYPTGVMLSHKNMVIGAESVAEYLKNCAEDRLLAVLPFSFDYGFNQLTTAFLVGARVVLIDYLLPYDVLRTIAQEKITGMAAVPSLWIQLSQIKWPEDAVTSLRYTTNSGGAMPTTTLETLQDILPNTEHYLMYGLTEAFRSTYLEPEMIPYKQGSIGKAIPNAEVIVVDEQGQPCLPGEAGELIHIGPLVAQGYWNNPEKTAERFRPHPTQPEAGTVVWSGDIVKLDEEGYIYFQGREDEMIKTSGYRVSPTEVEDIIYQSGWVGETVCLGIPHHELGQAVVAVVTPPKDDTLDLELLHSYCRKWLPAYMVPLKFVRLSHIPLNPNGKFERQQLHIELEGYLNDTSSGIFPI